MFEYMRYRPRPTYAYVALLGAGIALLFAWELSQRFAWPTLFFFVIALAFAVTYLLWASVQVELTPTGLTIHRRFAAPHHINFPQIVSIEEAGRMTTGLTLVYYPLTEKKMIDLDDPRSLFLPGMNDQDQLLGIILSQMVE